jgi:hypothetical protein
MEPVFSVGPSRRLCNEDPRPAEVIIEPIEMAVEDD